MSTKSSVTRLPFKTLPRSAWDASVKQFNKGIVTAYKIAGFVLLTLILIGMFSYLSMSAFFLFSTRWAVPSILTPNNDKVVQAQLAWLGQRHELEKLEAELVSIRHDLNVAQLAIQTWGDFGGAYEAALGKETKGSKAKLAAVEDVVDVIKRGSGPVALSAVEVDRQLANGLINLEEHARLKAVAANAALERAERRQKAVELQGEAEGLRGLTDTATGLSVETLMRRRPLIDAKLETANQAAKETVLKAEITTMESLIKPYRDTVERMASNPYVRAASGELQVAFLPYSNLDTAEAGAPVYDCFLSFILCQRVGTVVGVVGGEILGNHPITGRDLRGRMVEMKLERPEHAESRSLVLGRPPFFI